MLVLWTAIVTPNSNRELVCTFIWKASSSQWRNVRDMLIRLPYDLQAWSKFAYSDSNSNTYSIRKSVRAFIQKASSSWWCNVCDTLTRLPYDTQPYSEVSSQMGIRCVCLYLRNPHSEGEFTDCVNSYSLFSLRVIFLYNGRLIW